jgi:hypothetical protein
MAKKNESTTSKQAVPKKAAAAATAKKNAEASKSAPKAPKVKLTESLCMMYGGSMKSGHVYLFACDTTDPTEYVAENLFEYFSSALNWRFVNCVNAEECLATAVAAATEAGYCNGTSLMQCSVENCCTLLKDATGAKQVKNGSRKAAKAAGEDAADASAPSAPSGKKASGKAAAAAAPAQKSGAKSAKAVQEEVADDADDADDASDAEASDAEGSEDGSDAEGSDAEGSGDESEEVVETPKKAGKSVPVQKKAAAAPAATSKKSSGKK